VNKRRLIIGGLLIVLLLGGYLVSRSVFGPSHGRATHSGATLPSQRPITEPLPATTVSSKYFQLDLPTGYKPQEPQTASGLLFTQTLTKPSTTGSLIITIAIKQLPEGSLSADPDFHLRETQSRYHLTNQVFNGEVVHLATDTDSAAVVAFWPHGNYVATIAVRSGVSNPFGDDTAEQQSLQPLLKAWQWR